MRALRAHATRAQCGIRPLSPDLAVQYAFAKANCVKIREDAMTACNSGGDRARMLRSCSPVWRLPFHRSIRHRPRTGRRATSRSWCRSAPAARPTSWRAWLPTSSSRQLKRDLRRREPPGRRRYHRRRRGREIRAGRLHGAGLRRARDRQCALQQASLRHAQRFRAGDPVRDPAAGDRRLAGEVQDARRPDRRRQGEAGLAELFLGGRRLGVAFRGRAAARQRRHQGPARPLQGRRRSGDGSRRRAHRLQPATAHDHAAADQRRQAQSRSRSARTSASPPCRTCRRRSRPD